MPRRSPAPTPSYFTGAASDGLRSESLDGDGATATPSRSPSFDASDVTPASSAGVPSVVTDPLDDFLERYTCDLMPEQTVAKLKKR